MCVSGFPTLPRFFAPDLKHFIVNYEQTIVKYAGNSEKCNFQIKHFDKIK